MATIVQNAGSAVAADEQKVDQTLNYRGPGNDGIHRVQVNELSADEDGVITRKTGFIEVISAAAATKLLEDLSGEKPKKLALMGGRQQRNGNIFNVTVSTVAE